MVNCPMCSQAAHTRSSFQVSSETKERYNQCTNIECGHTFMMHETFVRSVCRPQKSAPRASSEGNAGTISLLILTRRWRVFHSVVPKIQKCKTFIVKLDHS